MSGQIMKQLLESGEYDEFEDVVLAEGEFIEKSRNHTALRQVTMGMTSQNLLIATRNIVNYKLNPEVYYQTDLDPDLDGLEMCTAWHLCLIQMSFSKNRYELVIRTPGSKRYYLLTNTHTNGNLDVTWAKWRERVIYLKKDPYGYIKNMFDEYKLPYPHYFLNPEDKPEPDEQSGANEAGEGLNRKTLIYTGKRNNGKKRNNKE